MAGLYFHIPFCKQACNYCNFHFSTQLKNKTDLVDAIIKELHLELPQWKDQVFTTIYFGGGTPSLLSEEDLTKIFTALGQYLDFDNIEECTLEANPDDCNDDYLKMLRTFPIDRLSMGVQSFHEQDLKWMNRAHKAQQSIDAIINAQNNGFAKITIDLIYGTPGLTDELWLQNLEMMKSLNIRHFSSYALTLEEGTALAHSVRKGMTQSPDDDVAATQFEILQIFCAANGYQQYEVSNFCLGDEYAVHNTNYWMGVPYLGIGPAAHTFKGNSRIWNKANNAIYIKNLSNNQLPDRETEILSVQDQYNEYLLTKLRTQWGVTLEEIVKRFGNLYSVQFEKGIKQYIDKQWVKKKDNSFVITEKGRFYSDGIAADLFEL